MSSRLSIRKIISYYETEFDHTMNNVESMFQFKFNTGKYDTVIKSKTAVNLKFAEIDYLSKSITIYPDLMNRFTKSFINDYGEEEIKRLIAKRFGVPNFFIIKRTSY